VKGDGRPNGEKRFQYSGVAGIMVSNDAKRRKARGGKSTASLSGVRNLRK